jgi:hypothetical protein
MIGVFPKRRERFAANAIGRGLERFQTSNSAEMRAASIQVCGFVFGVRLRHSNDSTFARGRVLCEKLKREKPHWDARRIREHLLRRFSCEAKVPARSTIHAVLDRHGLVERRGRKPNRAQGTPLSLGQKPNELS